MKNDHLRRLIKPKYTYKINWGEVIGGSCLLLAVVAVTVLYWVATTPIN